MPPNSRYSDFYDTIDALYNCEYLSSADINQAFYNIALHPDDRQLTSFRNVFGQWQLKSLVMGMKCSPSLCQRAFELCMVGLLHQNVLLFIDDLLIYSLDWETLK